MSYCSSKAMDGCFPSSTSVCFQRTRNQIPVIVFLKDNKKYAAVFASIHPGTYKSSTVKINSYLDNKNYFAGDPKAIGKLKNPLREFLYMSPSRFREKGSGCGSMKRNYLTYPRQLP
jgi:hypothetical protein